MIRRDAQKDHRWYPVADIVETAANELLPEAKDALIDCAKAAGIDIQTSRELCMYMFAQGDIAGVCKFFFGMGALAERRKNVKS